LCQAPIEEQSESGAGQKKLQVEQSTNGLECKVSEMEQFIAGAKALSDANEAIRQHRERETKSAEQSADGGERKALSIESN
jgi:hypothetical protein